MSSGRQLRDFIPVEHVASQFFCSLLIQELMVYITVVLDELAHYAKLWKEEFMNLMLISRLNVVFIQTVRMNPSRFGRT